jgi:hypothetical protein
LDLELPKEQNTALITFRHMRDSRVTNFFTDGCMRIIAIRDRIFCIRVDIVIVVVVR